MATIIINEVRRRPEADSGGLAAVRPEAAVVRKRSRQRGGFAVDLGSSRRLRAFMIPPDQALLR
jgi:hypothetical protein